MSWQRKHGVVAAAVIFIICSETFHDVLAQQDQCLVRCENFKNLLKKFMAPSIIDSYHTACVSKCSPAPATNSPVTTTTSAIRAHFTGETACGVPSSSSRNRIVGGLDADECEYPFMVGISIGAAGFCGGTIIGKNRILTAAHCLKDVNTRVIVSPSQVIVRVGSSYLNRQTAYRVKRFTVHPQHVPVINDFDVAVIILETDLTYSECVAPICLPDGPVDFSRIQYCEALGWGITNEYSRELENNLQKVTLPIVDNAVCARSYRPGYVNQYKLCAGNITNGGIDSCRGDSGGPLSCLIDHRFINVGIVSFGAGCARRDYPGIYTYVGNSVIRSFIDEASKAN